MSRFALPPLSTKLRTVMEAHIERLSELRWADIASKTIDEDSPADLRALASFVKEFAKTSDDVLRAVAEEAGLLRTPNEQAQFNRIVFGAVDGELLYALTDRAEELEAERAPRGDSNDEHKLTTRQMGVGK